MRRARITSVDRGSLGACTYLVCAFRPCEKLIGVHALSSLWILPHVCLLSRWVSVLHVFSVLGLQLCTRKIQCIVGLG